MDEPFQESGAETRRTPKASQKEMNLLPMSREALWSAMRPRIALAALMSSAEEANLA